MNFWRATVINSRNWFVPLIIRAPDMAFERDLVTANCKIKAPKVSFVKNPNLTGGVKYLLVYG